MKKHMITRRSFLKACSVLGVAGALAACGGSGSSSTTASSTAASSAASAAGEAASYNIGNIGTTTAADVPTITLYPQNANLTSGLVEGYRGEYFASRGFNVEVWAYSDEKTNAILASGDLPDIMYMPVKNLDAAIQSGMVLQLDDYLPLCPHVQSYEPLATALNYMREYRSNGTGNIYALPVLVGDSGTHYQSSDPTDRNAVKVNWKAYQAAGCPEVTSMDQLWDVVEQMYEAMPVAEDGNPMYGTVLNSGSDTTYWACMQLWFRMQGYSESELPYLLECNMPEGTATSILSTDSMYYKGLKWYNIAYKRGLIDPDSVSNDRATQKPKADNGYVLLPSGTLPGWMTQGSMPLYVPGTKIYYDYTRPYGDSSSAVLVINSKTQNLEACLNFIDMFTDPNAYLWIHDGPAGAIWEVDDNGVANFTEEGLENRRENANGNLTNFKLDNGEEVVLWNTYWIVSDGGAATTYTDSEGNPRMDMVISWTEANEIGTDNDMYNSWREVTGHDSWMEWLESENAYYPTSDLDYVTTFESIPDDMMQLTVDSIKDVVTTASWKMVYAETNADFDALWNQMVSDCEGLGAQDVIDWRLADIENAKKSRDALKA